jgi:hypothetical protein
VITRFLRLTPLLAGLAAAAALLLPGSATATTTAPTVPVPYAISLFASAPTGTSGPDDICRLDGHLFVGYQNGVGPNGEANGSGGTVSTLVEYNDDGSIATQWNLVGKIDGLGSDAPNHRVIATVNEDSNSSLYTITPSAAPSVQVVHYSYSPNPSPTSGSGPLLTGGGTDSITVMPSGAILVSASNPQSLGANPQTITGGPLTAAFLVALSAPSGSTGTASLSPSFLDDSQATIAPADTTSAALDLSDPDSNSYVPYSSPLYGNHFAQVSQGDHQIVFASDAGLPSAPYNASDLTVLNLQEKTTSGTVSAGIDDVHWADGDGGTLYVVDASGGAGGNGAIYAISGPFYPGEALATVSEAGAPNSSAVTSDGRTVDTLNLATGVLTPLASGFVKAAGEVWVPAGGGGDTGVAGPPGATGAAGPRGPAGHSELVICIAWARNTVCSNQLVGGPVFAGDGKPVHATLSRAGERYASGTARSYSRRGVRLDLTATRALPRGRYRLTLELPGGRSTTRTITVS